MNYLFLIILFSQQLFAQGDPIRGKQKAQTCLACHGENGISQSPDWPNLAGQKENYIILQLKNFKSTTRYHAVMSALALPLSDQDIEDLAKYYSTIKTCPK